MIGLLFLIFLKRHIKANQNSGPESWKLFLKHTSLGVAWTSTALAFAAAISITQTTSALQFLTTSFRSPVVMEAGLVLQVLQWLICTFSFFFAFGLTAIFRTRAGSTSYDNAPPPPPSY